MEQYEREKICRLCLKIIYNNSYEYLEENVQKNLNDILFLELYPTKTPVICKDCARDIHKSYSFKSMCIYNEKYVTPFITPEDYSRLNLKEVYFERSKQADVTNITDTQKVCRFCLNLTEYFVLLNDIRKSILFEMLEVFLPEMNLNITKESTACEACLESLQSYFSFIMRCIDIEDKINNYIESKGIDRTEEQALLSGVLKFIFDPVFARMKKICLEHDTAAGNNIWLGSSNLSFDADELSESKSYLESSKIKEEYFQKGHDPENDRQQVEKVFVIGKSVVVKSEIPPELIDEEDLSFNDNIPTHFMQVENISIGNEDTELIAEPDHKNFAVMEQSDINSCFQNYDGCSGKSRVKIKHTGTQVKLGRSSEIILYKHKGDSEPAVYTCKICGYETKYKHVAIRHSLIHKKPSEITMYKCDVCSYQTKYKTYLKPHMLIHKTPSEMIMYKCNICSHETKRKELLTRHMLSHKDPEEIQMYECSLCDFKGKQKSYLKRHSVVHINYESQLYRCAICSFGTKHKQGLRRHMITHKNSSEITMYRCEICPYMTKYKKQCKRHMLTHKSTTELICTNVQ